MLFLSEQDVKDALAGGDAYREAVDVIERVLEQQSRGTTHHLKRSRWRTQPIPAISGTTSAYCRPWCRTRRRRRACLFRIPGHEPVGDYLPVRLGGHADVGHHFGLLSACHPHQRALRRGGEVSGPRRRQHVGDHRQRPLCPRHGAGHLRRAADSNDPGLQPESTNVRSFCKDMCAALGIAWRHVAPAAKRCEGGHRGNGDLRQHHRIRSGLARAWRADDVVAPGEFDEQTVLRSRVYLSATEQVLGDDPPRKPFDTSGCQRPVRPRRCGGRPVRRCRRQKAGPDADDEIILYECAGPALLDVGIGSWVYQRAKSRGLGTEMPFGEH